MKILKVGIKNLNSLRLETSIDFMKDPIAGSSLFAITGDTGSGKTTILDAITLALYGRVHRNKDVKEVMSYGAFDCYAEIEFESGNKKYFAKWSLHRAGKKADGNFQTPKRELAQWDSKEGVFKIIAEKIKDVDLSIEEVSGLDYDRFTRSVMLSQGDFAAFLKSGEKERSDLLERITGTEIYSKLSIAAFRKHKEEENKFQDLNRELEGLKVLDEEDLKALEKELKHLKKESKSVKKELEEKQTQLSWLHKMETLGSQVQTSQEEIEAIEQEKQTAEPNLERLTQHNKTIPFHTKLSKLEDLSTSETETGKDLNLLNNNLLNIEQSEKSKKESLDQTTIEFKSIKEELSKKSKLFDKVIALDIEIKEKKEPLDKDQIELQKQAKNLNQLQDKQELNVQNLDSLEQKHNEASKWLKDHKIFKNLIEDLPTIKLHYDGLRTVFKNRKEVHGEINKAEKLLQSAKKQFSITTKKLEDNKKETKKLLAIFSEQAPEEFVQSRNELLNKLSEEIENLGTHNKNLQNLKILNDEYESLMKELSQYEDRLENLRQEQHIINTDILSSLEAIDRLQSRLEFKQQIYEQQLMIANYEKDRSSLKDGEPCPLCFSESHPFRKQKLKPFTDQAKQELELVKDQYKLMYQPYQILLNRQKDLELQIEALAGSEVKELSGQVQNQFNKLLEYEGKISRIAPELPHTDFSHTRGSILNLKILDFEKKLVKNRKQRKKLIALDSKLEKFEKAAQKSQNILNDQELQITRIEEKLKLSQEMLSSSKVNFEKTTIILNKILKRYGLSFEVETAKQTFAQLEAQKLNYEEYTKQEIDLKGALELCKQEKGQLKEQAQNLKTALKSLQNELDVKSNKLVNIENQRKEIFGDLVPEIEKTQLLSQILDVESKLETSKLEWDEKILSLNTTKTSIAEKEKQLERIISKIIQLKESLNTAISESGFENIELLQQAILSHDQAADIQKQSEVLKEREIEIRQTLKNAAAELKKEEAKNLTTFSKDSLEESLAEIDAQFRQFQQGIGANQEKINHNDQLKKESQALLKNINKQRKEYNRWAKLNEIIGMADGKKFRVFAQGLTLKKLTVLANKHLEHLNGRYFIYKRSDENLTLDIIDTFQADNIRSMNTLSGGESFLVSLALALGLSDLAGRNTTINSLFIDEGFGSLDEATLDLAISTLENLQSTGKIIGIISHVKALKEQISTQIMLKKKASGFSELEIIG